MKFCWSILLVLVLVNQSHGQTQAPKIKVLLLGTFHFGNTSDKNKTSFPDLFTARRQQELGQIASKLKTFGVDKFFVESHFTRQSSIDSLYALYQQGKIRDTLTLRNEILQIGFRTAALSNCKLMAADFRQDLPYDAVETYEKAHENDSIYSYPFFTTPYPFKKSRSHSRNFFSPIITARSIICTTDRKSSLITCIMRYPMVKALILLVNHLLYLGTTVI